MATTKLKNVPTKLKQLIGINAHEAAIGRNAATQAKARTGTVPTVTDSTTQRLIDQAKARSAASVSTDVKPEPQPSATGELTYTLPAMSAMGSGGDINKQIGDVYGQKVPDFLKDASKDANRIYAPVFGDLDKQQKLAQSTSASNTKQLNSMYGTLASNIGNEGKNISKRTGSAVADSKAVTANTVDAVGNNFSNANGQAVDLMRSLGISAAAGDVLGKGAEHQAFLQSLVQNEGMGNQSLAKQLGQNSLNYNSAQKNIAGFEGAQNVAANQKDLSNKLAELATTRANVGSQRAGQASSLAQQLRGDYTNSLNSRASALVSAYAQQQNMAIAQLNAQAGIQSAQITADGTARAAASKAAAASQPKAPSLKQQYDMTSPGEKIFATAAQLFGSTGQAASNAVNLANHVASNNASRLDANGNNTGDNRFPTAARYAEAVTQANNAQPPEKRLPNDKLLALAYAMFKDL